LIAGQRQLTLTTCAGALVRRYAPDQDHLRYALLSVQRGEEGEEEGEEESSLLTSNE